MTRGDAGFTLLEAVAALALTTVVLSTVLALVQPSLDVTMRIPEATDLHERGRAAERVLRSVLDPAGAGADLLGVGPLPDTIPALWPRRLGRWGRDADASAWADRFTVLHVPWLAPQAPLAAAAPAGTTAIELLPHPSCGLDGSCGFRAGHHVLVADARGMVDFAQLSTVGPVLHRDAPAQVDVAPPAFVASVDMTIVYFDGVRRQLRRYDGVASDQPLIDDVVWMAVRYYADPLPPHRPALEGEETCVVDAAGAVRLALLGPAPAPLVELSPAALADGPWCGQPPWRFDADLLRVRAVRIGLRLQAASDGVRGVGLDWLWPGSARRPLQQVRDLGLDVFVAPRVLASGG